MGAKFISVPFLFYCFSLYSQIVINEIFPAPRSGQTEWIEIYNPSNEDVVLERFYITNRNSTYFNNLRILIPANSFVVLTGDTSLLQKDLICSIFEVKMPVLHNDNDIITIRNSDSLLIDSVSYEFLSSWSGNSIERINWGIPAFGKTNWAKCTAPEGNSICRKNYSALPDFHFNWEVTFDNGILRLSLSNRGRLSIQNFSYKVILLYKNDIAERSDVVVDSATVDIPKNSSIVIEKSISILLLNINYSLIEKMDLIFQYDSIGEKTTRTETIRLNVPKMFSGILINEFMYEAEKGCAEFIEFFNNSSDTILLTGWKISNRPTGSREFMILINSPNIQILPRDYFVVIWDSMFFNCFEDLLNSDRIYYSSEKFALKNEGDEIKVYDLMGILQDSLSYTPKWHKYNVKSIRNRSLEKIFPNIISYNEQNWFTCVDQRGSTPTKANSIKLVQSNNEIQCKISPNPFSPRETNAIIVFTLPFKQSRLTAKIFDLDGIEIRGIINNELFPSEGEIIWDGMDGNKNYVAQGGYVLYLEAVDIQTGEVSIYKHVVGVGY